MSNEQKCKSLAKALEAAAASLRHTDIGPKFWAEREAAMHILASEIHSFLKNIEIFLSKHDKTSPTINKKSLKIVKKDASFSDDWPEIIY